jgi:CheY-like chemotaxis protein
MTNQFIFVANDDQAYVDLISELLAEAGYPKTVWHVGQGAFHRIRDEQPDLVLLDINLINPGRGWSTLDALRLHPKTRDIPVILCSTGMRLITTLVATARLTSFAPGLAGFLRGELVCRAFVVRSLAALAGNLALLLLIHRRKAPLRPLATALASTAPALAAATL